MIYHTHHLIQYNHHFIQCKNNLIHYQRSRINNDLNLIQHYIFQIRMPESTAAQPAHKKAVKFIVDEPSEVSQKPAILASQSSSIPKESHVHNGDSKTVMSKNDTSAVLAADVGDEEHFPKYQDDQLPDGVDVPKLNKRYRALPEEFYTPRRAWLQSLQKIPTNGSTEQKAKDYGGTSGRCFPARAGSVW